MKPDADADNVNGKYPLPLVILPLVVKPLTSSHSREREMGAGLKNKCSMRDCE